MQVGSFASSDWAQSLPQLIRSVERAGLAKGENKQKLEQARELLASGKTLDPTEACAMFSTMLEIQGRPPGSTSIVLISPSKNQPLAVTGQTCSAGRYTTVMVANEDGLEEPLPEAEVAKALESAHQRGLG